MKMHVALTPVCRLMLCCILILSVGLGGMLIFGFEGGLSTDFIQQLIPFYAETRHAFMSGELPLWTWNAMLGDNFIALFSYYTLFNPTAWLICAFPVGYMGWGIVLSLYVKTCLTAWFACLYLRRLDFPDSLCVAGALVYTFTSFYITGLIFYFFVEPVMMFALLLWAIEGVRQKTRHAFVALSAVVFWTTVINYYFAIGSLLCGAIYLSVRLLCEHGKGNMTIFFRAVIAVMLGLAGSMFILLPTAMYTLSCPRLVYEGMSMAQMAVLIFERVFYALFPRLTEIGYTAFVSQCFSSITLFLPAVGLLGAVVWCRRYPRHWAAVLVIILAVFYFTPLNAIFTLFTQYKYQRWGYAFQMALIVATLYLASEGRDISKKAGPFYILVMVLSAALQWGVAGSIAPDTIRPFAWTTVVFGLAAGGVTWWCASRRFSARAMCAGTLLVASANFLLSDWYMRYDPVQSVEGFSSDARLARNFNGVGFDESKDKEMHWRTDINTLCPNQGMIENRPGVLAYISGISGLTSPFRQFVSSTASNQQMLLAVNRQSLASLLSMRYFRDYHLPPANYQAPYRMLPAPDFESDEVSVYTLPDYIPMGMAVDRFLPHSEFKALYADVVCDDYNAPYVALERRNDSIDLCLQMLANLVVEDTDTAEIGKWLKRGAVDPTIRRDSVVEARRAMTAESFTGTRRGFTAEFDSPRDGFYFLSVPNDPGFTLRLDGEQVKAFTVNLGMMGVAVPAGRHTLTGVYTPPGWTTGCIISLISLILWLWLLCISYRKKL